LRRKSVKESPGDDALRQRELVRKKIMLELRSFRNVIGAAVLRCYAPVMAFSLFVTMTFAGHADIIGPGPRPQPPTPPPLLFVKGPQILDKIHKAGFDCAALSDVVEEPRRGTNPVTYADQHVMPLMVTCSNGKKFFVTLPYNSGDPGGEVAALD
jgi:hypothetical protein